MENIEYVRPQDIEKRSFEIITKELNEKGIVTPEGAGTRNKKGNPYKCRF